MSDYDRTTQLNQENSPLLRLPAELRNRIYNFALYRGTGCFDPPPKVIKDTGRSGPWPTSNNDKSDLALLSTCRQVQSAASILYYALNTFRFKPSSSLDNFTSTLAPAKLNAVKSIDIDEELAAEIEMRAELSGNNGLPLKFDVSTSLQNVTIYAGDIQPRSLDLSVIGLQLREATRRLGLEVSVVRLASYLAFTSLKLIDMISSSM
ncbi:hypothetical protein BKA58DRAFT_453287 [Alternaria rosae]|uniref:uncharacterized protein n=1 Tax=Alternaria rosae TaxID=1187941 RepID=UPI001E8D6712|nr:uncharacterized protein BKA58DRAFT_453287 [Alternaria rosae]KAH6879073.1 hypothetical protein BKA58DRAFT_453287 [Alternaria rosae]